VNFNNGLFWGLNMYVLKEKISCLSALSVLTDVKIVYYILFYLNSAAQNMYDCQIYRNSSNKNRGLYLPELQKVTGFYLKQAQAFFSNSICLRNNRVGPIEDAIIHHDG